MMKVRDIMHARVARIGPDDSLAELIRLLARERISGVPVVEPDCRLVGVVSATDLLAAVAEQLVDKQPPDRGAGAPADTESDLAAFEPLLSESVFMNRKVKEFMTPLAFSVPPNTPVSELASMLRLGEMHRALVVEHGHLCGIVTAFDVLRAAAS